MIVCQLLAAYGFNAGIMMLWPEMWTDAARAADLLGGTNRDQ